MHKLEHALLVMAKKTDDREFAGGLSYLAGIAHNYEPPELEELDIPDGHDLLIDHTK